MKGSDTHVLHPNPRKRNRSANRPFQNSKQIHVLQNRDYELYKQDQIL